MAQEVRAALQGRSVLYAHNDHHADGLAGSLRTGLAALPPGTAGAIVCLGDMPLVPGAVLDRLIDAFDPEEGRSIVLPAFQRRPGNPVLWGARFFPGMANLSGDTGARGLLADHAELVAEVPVETDAVLRDFDTAEALADLPGAG
jgi:molybdenum cofactor cytidylyltransferase